jgi:hypothetical protein
MSKMRSKTSKSNNSSSSLESGTGTGNNASGGTRHNNSDASAQHSPAPPRRSRNFVPAPGKRPVVMSDATLSYGD